MKLSPTLPDTATDRMPKYVLYFWDGIGGYSFPGFAHYGWHVWDGTAANNVNEAKAILARLSRATYRETPTEDGGPWCDVYRTDQWDGISYGDPVAQVKLSRRLTPTWVRWG